MNYAAVKPDREGYVDVDGGKIYYRMNYGKASAKKAPVLAVHGGPGMSHSYLLSLLELTSERDVILYDQLDAGKSIGGNDNYYWTLEHFTDEIDCIRTALGLAEVNIFGSSWGCSIVLNYAARRPGGIASLTLSGALISTERWMSDNTAYRKMLPQDVQDILDSYEKEEDYSNPAYWEAVDVFYKRHLCRLEEWPDYLKLSLETSNTNQYNYMWGPTEFLCTGTLTKLDLQPVLPSVYEPVLYICGEFDEGSPASMAYFAGMMPNAEVYTVMGASHTPHIEKPVEFTEVVNKFLR